MGEVQRHPGAGLSRSFLPCSAGGVESVDTLELEVPDTVAKAFATALELAYRTLRRAFHTTAIGRQVTVTGRYVHYFEHVLGILFPVGGHVQHTTDFQLLPYQFGKGRLDDTPFVMTRL